MAEQLGANGAQTGPALLFGTAVFPLRGGSLILGRADPARASQPDIDLSPFDIERLISRQHAAFECGGSDVIMQDLGSANGTFIDGEPLPPHQGAVLKDRQCLRFGPLTLVFSERHPWPVGTDSATLVAPASMAQLLHALSPIRADPGAEDAPRGIVERVRGVLDGHEVFMAFQPIVDLQHRSVVGVEALARISAEPHRGPDLWFQEAFSVGLGIDLELAVADLALRQLPQLPEGVYLSLNASPDTILSTRMTDLLRAAPLPRVILEVTEHATVTDYEALLDALAPLRAEGLRLAIDDMGSGYANMRHVLGLAPEVIKLDIALVRGIDKDPVRQALAVSLTSFASAIGSAIVAEGIETSQILETVRDLGISLGQGFQLAHPGPLPLAPLDL